MPKVIVAIGIAILCVVAYAMFSWVGNAMSVVQQIMDRLDHIALPQLASLVVAARHLPSWVWVVAMVFVVLVLLPKRR